MLIIFGVILLIGCPHTITSNSPSDCPAAEAHLKQLSCIPATKLYTQDNTFSEFCQLEIQNNIYFAPTCLSQIKSCDQMDACLQNKDKQ